MAAHPTAIARIATPSEFATTVELHQGPFRGGYTNIITREMTFNKLSKCLKNDE